MKRPRTVVAVGILLIFCMVVAWRQLATRQSVENWLRTVEKPGFVLLYSARYADRYVAVFDSGDGFLVLADSEYTRAPGHRLSVTADAGQDPLDPARKFKVLTRHVSFGILKYDWVDGTAVPIKPGFDGMIRVEYSDDSEMNTPAGTVLNQGKTVLDVVVPWKPEPDRAR